ncbi:YciI family protein [Luteimonas saliphila]|uniref:YciI family protein n=1 Tax=Luteimonas saliphila TaxID=2804919 RepID=UPI00192D6ABD|nr:YciI family protein [Luteimonas saliphila]
MPLQTLLLALLLPASLPLAAAPPAAAMEKPAGHDAALAARVGADERGMRRYVLVILRTGTRRMPDGPRRDAMFAGHFANMKRLSDAGQLALAGPFVEHPEGWRGLYVFAVDSLDEAKALAETDPVVVEGEMVPEYHAWYGSAALMMIPQWHERLVPPVEP